ncbi:MAG TPA: hypothetical protein VMA32_14765 [Streptosporangiaceae bacterium]|nr:hypothetical protein [Streptosporangiaceae bacterium]
MSSDGRRAAGEADAAAELAMRAAAANGSENGAVDGTDLDPWFDPGPKNLAATDPEDSASANEAPEHPVSAQWFLPTGRAGLLPESMTVSADSDQPDTPAAEYPAQVQAAGAPPWDGESTGQIPAVPPPWETGPWPAPSEFRVSRLARDAAPGAADPAWSAPASGSRQFQASQPSASGPFSARTVLTLGLVPLVVPGVVAGVLGLRRSAPGEPVRRASILAIAASLAWAVIIILLVATTSGGSAGDCRYPAAAHQAYVRAMSDLGSNAADSVKIADLGLAASRANAAAAATATGDVTVRSALFAMTADLQQARSDIIARRPVPGSLRSHLASDETALTTSCPS